MDKYEQELFISPNTKILNKKPENMYRKRFCAVDNLAEVYHENSKIHKRDYVFLRDSIKNMININAWAYETFNCTLDEDLRENQKIVIDPLELKDEKFKKFYEILFDLYLLNNEKFMFMDIFVLLNGNLYQVTGATKKLVLQMNNINISLLKESLICDYKINEDVMVFFIARPWRYMRFIGYRGYRQCLIDIGEISSSLKEKNENSFFIDYFVDNEVNGLLDIDGIENACVRILVIR